MAEVRICPNRLVAARTLATLVAQNAEAACALRDRFTLVLSGGNSPREAYKLIGDEFANDVDWIHTHVFWGDERCVPYEHPDNNAKMARETFLDYVPIPLNNIHRVQSFLPPEEAATQYERELHHYFDPRGGTPRFDLIILGMGADGHTASLFPGTKALNESERWVVANYVEKLDSWRITLTMPILNAAAHVVFYVLGEDKSEAVSRVAGGDMSLPATQVNPPKGKLTWILDNGAASLIENPYREE